MSVSFSMASCVPWASWEETASPFDLRAGASRLEREDLPRVHDVVRVERALDAAHHRDRALARLLAQELDLVQPDAVLARARATHRHRQANDLGIEALAFGDLAGIIGIDEQHAVEVAVADMADDRGGHLRARQDLVRAEE